MIRKGVCAMTHNAISIEKYVDGQWTWFINTTNNILLFEPIIYFGSLLK